MDIHIIVTGQKNQILSPHDAIHASNCFIRYVQAEIKLQLNKTAQSYCFSETISYVKSLEALFNFVIT